MQQSQSSPSPHSPPARGMHQPLTAEQRLARVYTNTTNWAHLPRLRPHADNTRRVAICGFGPSLAETYSEITQQCDAVITTSGALAFLKERSVEMAQWYHVELEQRAHKVWFHRKGYPGVVYYIASHCHPEMFSQLVGQGCDVRLWHGFTNEDKAAQVALVASLEPGVRLFAGGTNVGMRAIVVARELGFKSFDLFGMDCCYRVDGAAVQQWVGAHSGTPHPVVRVRVDGEEFYTSAAMMQSTDDFFTAMRMLPGCRFSVHGGGLLEARLKMYNQYPSKALTPGWWEPVDFELKTPG